MTKKVRIENADNSNNPLVVQVWDKGNNNEPHTLVSEHALTNPTDMTEQNVYGDRYLVVKES